MTEKESQAQDTHATEESQQTQQRKPRRQSFFQISKGHMISTKDLWLQKFKSNSAPANPFEQIDPPLPSPLELPHIEQLQPINTDISSEIQFHQHPTEQDLQVITEDTIEDAKNHESRNEDKNHQEIENEHSDKNTQSVLVTTDAAAADNDIVMADDPQHKQPNFKRSSILSKFFFPKQIFSTSDDSIIATESNINETQHHHQTELASGSDKEENVTNEQASGDNNNPDRYSSPLGRRINAVLSCIPTFKEKLSSGTDLDHEKVKKGSTIAAGGDTYSNEKLGSTIDKDTNSSRPVAPI